jgi:tetratricopeptide (TPR) repeat protein
MSALPPELPEPISAPRGPAAPKPPRGRDRALSSIPARTKTPPAPPPPLASPALDVVPPPAAFRPPVPTTRPRSPLRAWIIALAVVGAALAATVPFTLGVYFGNRDREQFLQRQAVEHFQRALAYEAETYTDLAVIELESALEYDPDYPDALAKLAELKQARTSSAQPEPNDVAIAKQLYASAEQAVAGQEWSDAIDLLEELQRVKSDYREPEVRAHLVRAYLNAGKQAITAGQMDIAGRRFQAVLALDPANGEARTYQVRIQLYLTGVDAIDVDWPNAVLALSELYARDPNFYDVKLQLLTAHTGYGDFAYDQGAYCIAAREYEAAGALGAEPDILDLAEDARAQCTDAILNPTPVPTPLPEDLLFVPSQRVNETAECNGTGGITGIVRDLEGNPLPDVPVRIYDDAGFSPPPTRTNADGTYAILLGEAEGLFHLVIPREDGANASVVSDVDYFGGFEPGCHFIIDWTKVQ